MDLNAEPCLHAIEIRRREAAVNAAPRLLHCVRDGASGIDVLHPEERGKKWLLVGTCDTICALFAASMWKMARPQVAARWTRRPAPPRGWCCTPPSRGTASAGSPSSTAQTATTTCHQRRCPGTPLSRANSKHKLGFCRVSQQLRLGALSVLP